jgi:hypothetical protein
MLRDRLKTISFLLLLLLPFTAPAEDWAYRIHQGENLTTVANRFLKPMFTPEQLQVYNGIINDRQIPIGTEIRVPLDWMQQSLAGVEVRYVFGEAVLYRRGQDEPTNVARGTLLKAGDRVVTGQKSAVSLLFADQSQLLIGPQSEVVFDALSAFEGQGMLDTRIRLQRGRLENRVIPIKSPGNRYEIHTPAAVTVVRGTDFRVAAEAASGLTRSEVSKGKVEVSAAGETVGVAAGEGTLIEQGQPPAAPRALLTPPDLSALAARYPASLPTIEWPALAQAISYRVQLMDDENSLRFSQQVTEAAVSLPTLTPGHYQLRVRGIDELGLEGLSARHEFEVEMAPEPKPSIPAAPSLEPPHFAGPWLGLRWQPVAGAWTHRLILARDPALRDILFEQLSQAAAYWIPTPPPGRYYLAVEALFDAPEAVTRSTLYRIEIPGWR